MRAWPRTGLLLAIQAKSVPTNVYVAKAFGVRVDIARLPSYDVEVIAPQPGLYEIEPEDSDRTVTRNDDPAAKAPMFPALSVARTANR